LVVGYVIATYPITNATFSSFGKVIWIGFSRTKETLDSFFKELGPLKSHAIKVAVMDMWGPYIASVKAHTNADIVFDKFPYQRKSTRQLTLFANKSLRKQTLKRERR
jgi:transposase